MKIAFIGTHSSGKSTMCKALAALPEFSGYYVAQEPMREVAKLGFKVNMEADDASQLAMAALHEHNLVNHENVIFDRSMLDAWIYARYINSENGAVTDSRLRVLSNLLWKYLKEYDYLFLCDPGIPVVEDGFRDTASKFRDDINDLFFSMKDFIEHTCNGVHIHVIKGTPEERLATVLDIIHGTKQEDK